MNHQSFNIAEWLKDFVNAPPGSFKDFLNAEELGRIGLTALAVGGGAFGLLTAIAARLGEFFPAPFDAGMAFFIFSAIQETIRRLAQGEESANGSIRFRTPRRSS